MPENTLTPLKKYSFKVFLAPVMKLFEVATELAMPFLTKYIVDVGIASKDMPYTLKLGGIMLILAVVGFLCTMVAQYLSASVSSNYGYDLRKDVYSHMNKLSEKQLSDYGKQKTLTLLSNDSFSMQSGANMFMRLILRPPFLLVGSTIISFVISYQAGFIFLGAILLSSLVVGLVMLVSPKKYAAIQSNLDQISVLSNDSLKGARPIKAFNKQEYEEKKFSSSVSSYEKKNMSMAKFNALLNPLTFFFINAAIALVVYVGNISISAGTLKSGDIIALIQYLSMSLAALIMFSRLIISVNKAMASKKRIDSFFALVPSIQNGSEKQTPLDDDKTLYKVDNVSLTYGKATDKPAIEGISFSIEKGSFVGMIGGTGSGKSSVLSLLERLYDPSSGTIYFEGNDLRNVDVTALRERISSVSQKPSLFKGTIRSNLLLAKNDATEEMMVQALKDSLAYEYVEKFPEGLEHPVEEAGANLSGGQKQRLLIARALLKGGDILILDDSTSALDYLSESQVRHNILKKKDLTKIIVSQRASSLAECDLILVFDGGHVIAMGKHDDLFKTCPLYHDICVMQRSQA